MAVIVVAGRSQMGGCAPETGDDNERKCGVIDANDDDQRRLLVVCSRWRNTNKVIISYLDRNLAFPFPNLSEP